MHSVSIFLPACAPLILLLAAGCLSSDTSSTNRQSWIYEVDRLDGPMTIDGNWDKPVWRKVEPLTLTHYMGDKPAHRPKVQAKMLYDDQALYLIWRVDDRYIRAVAKAHQDRVCEDSCVEFFFTPGSDIEAGYFNLEMNCGGIMLYHFQVTPRGEQTRISPADIAKIQIAHELPTIIDPEIAQPKVWTLEYRLPVDELQKYYPGAVKPAPGASWRANFFKCADSSSHPHWLTWAFVDRPKPDFHVPSSFGKLRFK